MSDNLTRVEAPGIAAAIYRATRSAVEAVADRVTGGERVIELVGTLPVVNIESLNDEIYTRGDRNLFPTDAEMLARDPSLIPAKRAMQILDWRLLRDRSITKYQYVARASGRRSPATLWVEKRKIDELAAGNVKRVPASEVSAPFGPSAIVAEAVVGPMSWSKPSRDTMFGGAGAPEAVVEDHVVTVDSKYAFGRTPTRLKPMQRPGRR